VAAGAASGITDTHEAIDREIANDFLENGVWVFLRGGNPQTPWHSLVQAIKAVTELGANPKRVCVCTDDRDADDLFLFGMDWVVRQAVAAGLSTQAAWSLGSLHPATRYALDGEIRRPRAGAAGRRGAAQRRARGAEHLVRRRVGGGKEKITPLLDRALSRPYRYPRAAYQTVKLPRRVALTPALPTQPVTANVIRVVPPGIVTAHDRVKLAPASSWADHFKRHELCFLTVVERHGKNGNVAHGLLRDFGLTSGAVASSVGHDAHNIVLAGTDEADMQLALATVKSSAAASVSSATARFSRPWLCRWPACCPTGAPRWWRGRPPGSSGPGRSSVAKYPTWASTCCRCP
jgi:adenine deaminase